MIECPGFVLSAWNKIAQIFDKVLSRVFFSCLTVKWYH